AVDLIEEVLRRAAKPSRELLELVAALCRSVPPGEVVEGKALLLGARALVVRCAQLEPRGVVGGEQLAGFDPPARLSQRRPLAVTLAEVGDVAKLFGPAVLREAGEGTALLGARLALGELE